MGGKGGGGGSGRAGKAAQTAANLSKKLFKETDPLRLSAINLLMDALGGGDILQNRFLVPQLGQIESSYDEGLRHILNNLPQGGSLDRALADLENRRAGSRADTAYKTRMGLFDSALNAAFGQPLSASLSGLNQAANTLGGFQLQRNQLAQQGALGLGQGLGSILGPAIGSGSLGSLFSSLGSSAGSFGGSLAGGTAALGSIGSLIAGLF